MQSVVDKIDTQVHVTNKARGKMRTQSVTEIHVRDFDPIMSDEPPKRGGTDTAPSPLEYMLVALIACTNVSTARMAHKIRFQYDELEIAAEGDLDTRGRKGEADVPVHYHTVRLNIRIKTDEDDKRLDRLADLVAHYCPVDSFYRAAVQNYHVTWQRIDGSTPNG
jgi:uncharacterized OsmC-like protein